MVKGWEKRSLLSCVDLLQGLTYSPDKVQPYGLLVLRSSNIKGGKLILNDCVYVDCTVDRNKYVKPNDILICVRNGSSALIGKSCVIDQAYNATFGAFMSVLRGDVTGYIAHVFSSDIVQAQIRNRSSATINQITKRDFEDIIIPMPDETMEQHAIAATLSDADAYISALEKLIAKKRNIKQGAMQELLTGKRRLPGFSDEWKEKPIGECANISSGGTPSTAIASFWNGGIFWCTPTDITKSKNKYLSTTEKTISEEGLKRTSTILLPIGTILLCSRATIGEMSIVAKPMSTNQGFKNLVCCKWIDNEFLYYLLQTKVSSMLELAIGSTFLEISKKALESIRLQIPSLSEQSAIAAVLSDMDSEIDGLLAKLNKAKQIKQGMMNELLTGRIRLL